MNLLDEQMREDQRRLLDRWRIPYRQIGIEIASYGTGDPDIIPLLHSLKHPTLFTHDRGFFQRSLCHLRYCLVHLDVSDTQAAEYIRRFLRHQRFDAWSKRKGLVARIRSGGVHYWKYGTQRLEVATWEKR